MTEIQTNSSRQLNAHDRCDRCGAQAYIRAVLSAGGELLFCVHHSRQVKDALQPQTQVWDDQSALLNQPA